jgi:SAM-dependent methyltransferase
MTDSVAAAVRSALGGGAESPAEAGSDAPATQYTAVFDPALFVDPRIQPDAPEAMVRAVREHLRRYSNHQSAKNAVARLEDSRWLDAWDVALRAVSGRDVVFCGSELGVFALRALALGARRVVVIEGYPLDTRIATGIVRKNQLLSWHAQHGEQMASASREERETSFERLASSIDIVAQAQTDLSALESPILICPNLDHSLLGTGIVRAIERCRELGLAKDAAVLPARAKVYAMGFQWRYSQAPFQLHPLNRFRWSLYPDTQDLPHEAWMPLTAVVPIGEIEFGRCTETVWERQLPVHTSGTLDGIMYWFDLDLGSSRLSNAPESGLTCVRPAIEYVDSLSARCGDSLSLRIHVNQTRMRFETVQRNAQPRSALLPPWYMPMIHDSGRNAAYEAALSRVARRRRLDAVLDLGCGCGLLSMLAVRAGAREVYGCEVSKAVCEVANAVIDLNGCQGNIKVIHKDCRQVRVPEDLPGRANVALFEMFDCSLIGEGVLHFLAHARENLLAADACYLPRSGRIRAMLIEYRLEAVWGIDVNLLNPYRFAPGFINVDADHLSYRALSEPFDVFTFDFATATAAPAEAATAVPLVADGIAGAVLFWFDLCLEEDVELSNEPRSGRQGHWKQGLQFMPEARVQQGQSVSITAMHDGSSLSFRWTDGAVPREAFLQLPRYDRAAWHDASQLEARTREMLQHCSADRREQEKLADLAMRLAIDPAAHGLDPRVAQRFAELFLRAV